MIIALASKSKVKSEAARLAFSRIFSLNREGLKIISTDFESKRKQPIGEKQTIRQAKKRALVAKKLFRQSDYWLGIEGGIILNDKQYFAQTWVVILSRNGKKSIAGGPLLPLPKLASFNLKNRQESLSKVIEKIEQKYSLKSKGGTSGRLTSGFITRIEDIYITLIYALVKFTHPDLY